MTKTPEQMAEEFFENWQPEKPKYIRPKARQYALEKVTECFLAGYQAGQEHPFQFQTKMWIEPIGPQNQWISVKDRLPEVGKEILWYHEPGGEFSVGLLHHEVEQPFFTHWMPLPEPPKEEK